MENLRVSLDYGYYPIQELDEFGSLIGTIDAKDLGFDEDFAEEVNQLQAKYDDLFINDAIEFTYIGEQKPGEVEEVRALFADIVRRLKDDLADTHEVKVVDLKLEA